MAKKKLDSNFIASVPEMAEEVRSFKAQTLTNPAIPFPWPSYVPKPEALDDAIAYLERVYEAQGDENIRTGGELGRARKRVKTRFSQVARYVTSTLEGNGDLGKWPGFDLCRNPGENRCRPPYRSSSPVVTTEKTD